METGNHPILHVIAFDVPWPADYGGVIDVWYKIKALSGAGVRIILHCFRYGRPEAEALYEFCSEVYYYPRDTGLAAHLSLQPYIVRSRRSEALAHRLLQDEHPILAEGIHCTALLNDIRFRERPFICRMANVEHEYYRHLALGTSNPVNRLFFRIESIRLKKYEAGLHRATRILAISPNDEEYFAGQFGRERVEGIYAFHPYDKVDSLTGRGDFILYHGRLDVPENYRAVESILPVFRQWKKMPLVVAGMNPPPFLARAIETHPNASLVANPDPTRMRELIRDAHAHFLLTHQPTGLKLKLLSALFTGRFVIANPLMVEGTGVEQLCLVCNTPEEMEEALDSAAGRTFSVDDIAQRQAMLSGRYSNRENTTKLVTLIRSIQ
ncbi:MAG: glycosyltransferase family 1 protein [Bacteroidales bacterium]